MSNNKNHGRVCKNAYTSYFFAKTYEKLVFGACNQQQKVVYYNLVYYI